MHEAHRPSYPEWSVKPDLERSEFLWAQLEGAVQDIKS